MQYKGFTNAIMQNGSKKGEFSVCIGTVMEQTDAVQTPSSEPDAEPG